jgi:Beta-1,3-glucanase
MKKFIKRVFRRGQPNKSQPGNSTPNSQQQQQQKPEQTQQEPQQSQNQPSAQDDAASAAAAPPQREQQQQPLKPQEKAALTGPTLQISFVNRTTSSTVYAYVTGTAINNNNALFLLQSDGHSAYYPTSPSSTGQPLQANCAIPLGAPGNTVNVSIPQLAGGRVWFSINSPLTFLLNPGK